MEENVSRGIETVVTHDLVQLAERHLELDSGQMGAEAAMDADAEGEAPFGSAVEVDVGYHAAGLVWDYESWDVLSARLVRVSHEAGALTALRIAYSTRAVVHLFAGDFTDAASLVAEAESVTAAMGSSIAPNLALALAALRGREAEAAVPIELATKDVQRRGSGQGLSFVQWAFAVLCNGLGRYEQALAAAQQASEDTRAYGPSNWAIAELIEAATRTGMSERAVGALDRLSEMTRASGTDWAVGIEARSRALITEGENAEVFYLEAIDRLGRPPRGTRAVPAALRRVAASPAAQA